MNLPCDIDELVQRHALGTITRAEMDTLEAWLREDPKHIEWFASYGLIEQGLMTIGRESTATDLMGALAEIDAAAPPVELVDLTDELKQRALDERQRTNEKKRRQQAVQPKIDQARAFVIPQAVVWLSLAATLGFAVWIGMAVSKPEQTPPVDPGRIAQPEQDAEGNTPVVNYVAAVRSSVDARWSGTNASQPTRLASDDSVTLTQGLAEVVFDDGAAIIVQAPATFEPTGNNGMRLIAGKITATIPDSAHGFTVDTASGLITDYGTEFGVIVNHDGQSLAQTFSGRIGLTPIGGAEVDLSAGDAVVAAPNGRVRTVEADELAFVRTEEFEAIRNADESPRDRWVAARYRMLRDPAVVAYVPCIQPGTDWPGGIGYDGLRVLDESTTGASRVLDGRDYRNGIDWRGDVGFGGALVANGADPIFIDLDTEPGGAFDAAGLLDDNGLIGRSGMTLYIAWRMQSDGTGLDAQGYAGLSLMHGDQLLADEPLFIGKVIDATHWTAQAHPQRQSQEFGGITQALGATRPDSRVDAQPHLWVLRINFADADDRIAVYFDPPPGKPLGDPDFVLTLPNVSFDRLRFITGNTAMAWRLDELLLSTTPIFDTPSMLPGN